MRRLVQPFILISLIGLLLVGCGGSEPEATEPAAESAAAPEPVNITIEMTEYQYSPDTIELVVGQEVTLTLVNKGQLEHELMIGREVEMENDKPAGYHVDMFEHAGVEPMIMEPAPADDHEDEASHEDDEHGHGGFMATVPVGDETATMSFTVTEEMVGEWEMGCFLLEGVHYTSGMKGTLVVKAQ